MKVRSFIAINLSVAATRAAAEVMEAARASLSGSELRVAWVPAANLHLTLKFLGYVSEEAIEGIADRLRGELLRRSPFDVRAGGISAFPNAKQPRVIWVGIDDPSGALVALARDCDVWMSELGFTKEERAYRAHLTIGRVKEGQGSVEPMIESLSGQDCGVSTIREVVVYESKVSGKGSEYVARARVPIGKGGPVSRSKES